MSQTLLEEPQSAHVRRHRASRIAIVSVLLVSLVLSALTRDWARSARESATTGTSPIKSSSQTRISSMNSFTLALLLGGLRGPLVMMLWTSSETQKTEKNLEDFDTKVELIRLLQPEFDSVLIFQIWNKAYNISVQMSSIFNKYTTILDAIDYGKAALAAKPDNINAIVAVADVYFNKLGNASEKQTYRSYIRRESQPHARQQKLEKNDPAWRRIEIDPIVDAYGNILPELIKPRRTRPTGLPADENFNDGSEMQYLAPFSSFKYGVSPIAIAYNYYMKAQTLQRTTHARHAQLSDQVVDSRPAITLKFWAEEEQELGRRNEQRAFNINLPTSAERLDLEMPTAGVPLTQKPVDPAKITEAIYNYERSAQVAAAARAEYARHLKLNPTNLFTYQSHIDGLLATEHFGSADAAYLRVMSASGDEQKKWTDLAIKEYNETIDRYQRIMMKYYTDESLMALALPGVTREQIDSIPSNMLAQATLRIQSAIQRGQAQDSHTDDRNEYMTYITRCAQRLQSLGVK